MSPASVFFFMLLLPEYGGEVWELSNKEVLFHKLGALERKVSLQTVQYYGWYFGLQRAIGSIIWGTLLGMCFIWDITLLICKHVNQDLHIVSLSTDISIPYDELFVLQISNITLQVNYTINFIMIMFYVVFHKYFLYMTHPLLKTGVLWTSNL
jgi:hypothetical protein